jgi:hypothetical protein
VGVTYRFIQSPFESSAVVNWFSTLNTEIEKTEVSDENGLVFYFREFGPLAMHDHSNKPDPYKSPIVSIILPKIVKGKIWTVGEVHFLSTPLKELYAPLHKISLDFKRWLTRQECVFSNKPGDELPFGYYFGGDIMNFDSPVYSFPSGIEALSHGQFFISANLTGIDNLCQRMRLLGIDYG